MNTRNLVVITGLVVLGTVPIVARAHGAQTATDACVQAFVETYLPQDRRITVRKAAASSPLSVHATRYTIELVARTGRNGDELVAARCVANTSGRVLALESAAPSRGADPLRARLK